MDKMKPKRRMQKTDRENSERQKGRLMALGNFWSWSRRWSVTVLNKMLREEMPRSNLVVSAA